MEVTFSVEAARELSDVLEQVRAKSRYVLPLKLYLSLVEVHGVVKAAIAEAEAVEVVGSLSLEVE